MRDFSSVAREAAMQDKDADRKFFASQTAPIPIPLAANLVPDPDLKQEKSGGCEGLGH